MLRIESRPWQLLAAGLVFSASAFAQISGLCNTGETKATPAGCTGVLVPPANPGTNTNYDGNWFLGYYSLGSLTGLSATPPIESGVAWVTIPNESWLANSVSAVSEWISPHAGGSASVPAGWYVYRTTFPVPALLPSGVAPTGVSITGQLASDNFTGALLLESPAGSGQVVQVSGPVTPVTGITSFQKWWPFSFTTAVTAGEDAALYIVVQNAYETNDHGPSPTGLRVEFSSGSTFN